MSHRQPTSTLDSPFAAWISSLTIGDSDRKPSANQHRELLVDGLPDCTSPGLVHRCVVVQKDQLGFGFTVCGEKIKLVQNVRPGGAAVKAGVQEGDRIIKVNGSLVSSMSHQEVVKLIKSGTYVALTLQGPPPSAISFPLEPLSSDLTPNQRTSVSGEAPPPPPPPLPSGPSITPSQRITGPKPLQDSEVQKHASQILRKMLQQEEAELQELMEERLRNPSPSLEERIESAKRRAHQVRVKIQQDVEGTRSESVFSSGEARLSMEFSEGEVEVSFSPSRSNVCAHSTHPVPFILPPQTFESPYSSPLLPFRTPAHRRHFSDTQSLFDTSEKPQIISPEDVDDDDGNTFNEMDGLFQDIESLKCRQAHLMVFMRYIFTQVLDPNPLLFYLLVEIYLDCNPKDARGLATQICSLFLDPDAPLKMKVREDYLKDIESRLSAQEDIRGPLSELQQQVLPDIQEQIQDYRNKQKMGLASLFGEGDLQLLDGDSLKEKQVVDQQVSALWEILTEHEDDRSSPLASAVLLYLRHSGIKLRDSKVFPSPSTEKEKWLPFLKPKKLSSNKKDKDGDDRRKNPILKYIVKPWATSQSICPGSVKNIINQFENLTDTPREEVDETVDPQRLSSSSLGEEDMDSPMVSVRLARSESLKAQGERRRRCATSGGDSVPRSRSDVDMEDCEEERDQPGLRPLQHSASSSASSCSARSFENPTPPYTPRSRRRSVDSPLALLPDAAALEDDVCEGQNWQDTVPAQLLSTLSPREVDRQAVIYELFTTEVSHLRTLRVLDKVFFQKLRSVLSSEELACIFPNLPQVYELHASLCEAMKKQRESAIVQDIGGVMVARFEGTAGSEFQEQASLLCCQQTRALDLIKNKKRKDPRFAQIIQECEASPQCRRLQLKDLLVSEMQRLTKYPLLLDNIIKYTEAGSSDLPPLQHAQACCRGILQAVNEDVREAEHRQRLSQYQRRLDAAPQFKHLDLTTKRMIHEGPLMWRIGKDKQIEVQALLLSDYLVLLQRAPDDRLQLRYPSRWLGGGGGGGSIGDSKTSFSPLLKLESLFVRSVATDVRALFILSTTENQMYELGMATQSEKSTWKDLLDKAIVCAGGSLHVNHGSHKISIPPSSPSLRSASPVSTGSEVTEDASTARPCDSPETRAYSDDISQHTPTDPSGAANYEEKQEVCVAEAALQDVETLRQLILQDLDEDGWSHNSDDTPTNEMTNGGRSLTETEQPDSLETILGVEEEESNGAPPSDTTQPSVKVVRKAVVAGPPSSSLPDGITDDVSLPPDQSSSSRGEARVQGNTFYLVMPSEQGESFTDDLSDPPTPTASHFPPVEEVMPLQTQPEEDTCCPELNQSEAMQQNEEEEAEQMAPSKSGPRKCVIKNADEIFFTIEALMRKLHKLKEVEMAHNKLLETLRDPSFSLESEDQPCHLATVSRTPSMDRSSGDGTDGNPGAPKILSTGF
nr:rho guanine nucleotide exchange factor 11 isoform X2 [Nothobranchius furzeri]